MDYKEIIMINGVAHARACEFIQGALENAREGKGVDAWMSEVRTVSGSFYERTKAEKGLDVAECELEEEVQRRKYREIVASSAKIIAGVAVLAQAETQVPLVEFCTDLVTYPRRELLRFGHPGSPQKFLVVTNKTPHMYRCDELRHSRVWSPDGTLGLHALIISARVEERSTEDVSVTLMLVPPIPFGRYNATREGYVLVRLGAQGDMRFMTVTHTIQPHSSVLDALGKRSGGLTESSSMSGGDPADHLGFPGSYEYLLSNLDGLGEYLTDLAPLSAKNT